MISKKHVFFAAPILLAIFLLSGSCGGDTATVVTPEEAGSSVIVVAIDGLRADHLGCYGGGIETPAFDTLAAESVRFDQAWTQAPTMYPALASLLTGLYPTTHALVEPGDRLASEPTTLAEAATDKGLATAAFIMGDAEGDDYGLSQGFSIFTVKPEPGKAALAWLDQNIGKDALLLIAGWSAGRVHDADAMPAGYPERLAAVLESRTTEDPQLLNEDDLTYAKSAYAGQVARIDDLLATLVAELKTRGLLDRATLVVTATNGLALQEHDDLFGETLFPAVTHVPMFIRFPGAAKTATVTKTVEVLDLMPTLVEAMGAEMPAGLQGASLNPIINEEGKPPYIAFSETDQGGGTKGVAMGGMHLVTAGEDQWFADLQNDPLALTDVTEDFPKRAEVMKGHMGAWFKMVAAASYDPARRTEEVDDETLEQLKSLGYVQ